VTVASFETQTSSSIGYNCTKATTLAFHEGLKQGLKDRYKAYGVRILDFAACPFLGRYYYISLQIVCSKHRPPSRANEHP
jgi:hypothetical protein